jgi:hypothetical protein
MTIPYRRSLLAILLTTTACGCAGRHEKQDKTEPLWRVASVPTVASPVTASRSDDAAAASGTAAPAARRARGAVSSTNPLRGKPDMVDRLVMVDSAEAFRAGELKFVDLISDTPARLVLHDTREKTYPRYGSWTSAEVTTDFAFTELIPSWNATTPPNTGVRFEVRTRDAASGRWSPWLYCGQWGRTLANDERPVSFDGGTVHVDNLVLDKPADAYQIRARFESFDLDTSVNPSLRRVAVSYSGQVRDPALRAKLSPPPVSIHGITWARDLNVPFRAQGVEATNIRGSICSCTSTSMVMAYCGVDRPTAENALAIYDVEHDIFGNWGRAVQRAGEMGLDAWITRIRDWDQVKSLIAQGQPIIADINFAKGEFPSSVLKETDGHLIVIRGLKENGDAIVNDPASKDRGNGVIYKASELGKAWFENAGGVAYIIRKPATGAPVAADASK